MHRQLALCQRAFYLGLFLMLAAGILPAAVRTSGSGMALLMLTGAGVALGGRLWHRRLHRAARRRDDLHDLGGYPLDMLRDARFTSPHRP